MKSKAPLALMEQLVMVLVFALAAALCLQAFVLADRISRHSEVHDRAVLQVQNAAEVLKSSGGDLQACETMLGGTAGDGSWVWLPEGQEAYQITAEPQASDHHLLGSALVSAREQDGSVLFQVTVVWRKEAAHE